MDNVELSPGNTLGMYGLIQGLVCYLLISLGKKSQLDCLWRACDRRVFHPFYSSP